MLTWKEEDKVKEDKGKGRFLNTVLIFCLFGLVLFLYMDIYLTYERLERSARKTKVFGATYMTMNNQFYSVLNDEIRTVVEDNGERLITLDPALDQKKQNEEIEQLIERNVDAIFLNPVDWMSVEPALQSAKKAGIPVIVVDTPVYDNKLVACTIVSDNYNAGVQCAVHMMNLKSKADIVLIIHPNAKSAQERIQGFLNSIEGKPEYRVVAKEDGKGQIERTFPKMQKLLEEGINFDVILMETWL